MADVLPIGRRKRWLFFHLLRYETKV